MLGYYYMYNHAMCYSQSILKKNTKLSNEACSVQYCTLYRVQYSKQVLKTQPLGITKCFS